MSHTEKKSEKKALTKGVNDHLVTLLVPEESFIADLILQASSSNLPEILPETIKGMRFWFEVLLNYEDMDDATHRIEFLHFIYFLESLNECVVRHTVEGSKTQLNLFKMHRQAILDNRKEVSNG